jgi:hypothetical protein
MTQMDIKIPPHMVPLVLGRGGEKLRAIELACNVSIEITEKGDDPTASRLALIKGEESSCKEAR